MNSKDHASHLSSGPQNITRRLFLKLGAGVTFAAWPVVSSSWGQTQDKNKKKSVNDDLMFYSAYPLELAEQLAKKPYKALSSPLPEVLSTLSYEEYVQIRARSSLRMWHDEKVNFVIEPMLMGFQFTHPVELYTVGHDSKITRILPHVRDFSFNGLNIPEDASLNFSGFRVQLSRRDGPAYDLALFQGGTFFRALAVGARQETPVQNFGTTARVLTLNAGEPKGEEVPHFRQFFIEKPAENGEGLSIYGIFDSESVAGVAHFMLWPGNPTVTDLNVTLFSRTSLTHVGLGTLTAGYLFGPNNPKQGIDDVRSAAYDIGGLQIHLENGEWIWRAVNNPETLQISSFSDPNPPGFGLIQRDRNEETFFDTHQHFERRPSVWVKPMGLWGVGAVRLFELPSRSETNHNIITYWHSEKPIEVGHHAHFVSRIFWSWTPPTNPLEEPAPLAIVTSTHVGRGAEPGLRRFLVSFEGHGLAEVKNPADFTPELTSSPGKISKISIIPRPVQQRVVVDFTLDPEGTQLCELRLRLKKGEAILTETWLYRWTP